MWSCKCIHSLRSGRGRGEKIGPDPCAFFRLLSQLGLDQGFCWLTPAARAAWNLADPRPAQSALFLGLLLGSTGGDLAGKLHTCMFNRWMGKACASNVIRASLWQLVRGCSPHEAGLDCSVAKTVDVKFPHALSQDWVDSI